jgi:hypothetical protein
LCPQHCGGYLQLLNTSVAGLYSGTFTNASADIYITYGTTSLGESETYRNEFSYSAYTAALVANSNQDALQAAALSGLNKYDAGPYGTGNVGTTDALGTALGLTAGLTGITSIGGACSFPSAGCYNAITVTNNPSTPLHYDNLGGTEASNAYDFYAVVQHETDEVLGTSSCITTQTTSLSDECDFGNAKGPPSAVDRFR